jgi:NAD+ kinase
VSNPRIHFVASQVKPASTALAVMQKRYGQHDVSDADIVIALGGDGFMLRTLHRMIGKDIPVFGMKVGNIGFLMNRFEEDGLMQRLAAARAVNLNPLKMDVQTESGTTTSALAINEISLLRQTNQAAHIRILVNDIVKVENLICDGVLLATAAGSTAYNFSVRGPILPLGTDALALTPISPFRPRRWNGAILPSSARVSFEVLDNYKRAVSATADAYEVRDVVRVDAYEDKNTVLKLLFDPAHSLEERILNEQFR